RPTTTLTLPAAALAAALRAVRFAVGADPAFPVLGGVLLDVGADALTVVATDRYRLAVSSLPAHVLAGPGVAAVVPAVFADELAALPAGDVGLHVDGVAISARAGSAVLDGRLLDAPFPDYRRLLPTGGTHPVAVDAGGLRAAVAAGATRRGPRDTEVTVLSVDAAGRLVVAAEGEGVGVDAEFLLEAVDAGGAGQLLLELDGPLAPVTIRSASRADTFSLLMPVRL
ncbi:MAG: DNA polymerase III subunit beta, partial [Pseudonocardia sp.]|nr:DNA polymerase III subunit beta [Pseudonocardia sp.]